jgi:hypothetical protein
MDSWSEVSSRWRGKGYDPIRANPGGNLLDLVSNADRVCVSGIVPDNDPVTLKRG